MVCITTAPRRLLKTALVVNAWLVGWLRKGLSFSVFVTEGDGLIKWPSSPYRQLLERLI